VKNLNKFLNVFLAVAMLFLFTATAFSLASSAKSQATNLYTGYQVVGPYTTLRVKGSWIVPTANCAATPNSVSNISVIIDGISGEGDAMEIGTYQNCVSGVAVYGAFVNIYPMTTFYGKGGISKLVIHPGDVIEAQGTWRPSNVKPVNWNTNFVDKTTGQMVDTNARTSSTFKPVLDSGALILSSDGHTLTALSTISSGVQYTKVGQSDVTGPWLGSSTFGETGGHVRLQYCSLANSWNDFGCFNSQRLKFSNNLSYQRTTHQGKLGTNLKIARIRATLFVLSNEDVASVN
jgi:hypothetical protein